VPTETLSRFNLVPAAAATRGGPAPEMPKPHRNPPLVGGITVEGRDYRETAGREISNDNKWLPEK
jgi:hypothetical protein